MCCFFLVRIKEYENYSILLLVHRNIKQGIPDDIKTLENIL